MESIQTSKIELIRMILNIENVELIRKITDYIEVSEQPDFWDELSLLEKNEIREGIEDLERGDRIAYSEVLKKVL